jgi:hypothetical protein
MEYAITVSYWSSETLRTAARQLQSKHNYKDPARKVPMSQPGGSRPRGRPKLRWEDQVAEDAARGECRNWKRTAHNREDWWKLLKEAKAHPGL